MDKVVDCKGMVCPQPVIRTKEVLEQTAEGVIEVLVDNEASKSNVERFAKSQGCAVTVRAEGGVFHIAVSKSRDSRPAVDAPAVEDYVCDAPASGVVCVIPSDTMGRGDEKLGKVLMRAFIKTIKEVSPLPAKILFYNTGVRVTATESDLLEPLKALADKGVGIYSCGTCLDFFNLQQSLLVGEVTNMYDILDSMTQARKVVSPF